MTPDTDDTPEVFIPVLDHGYVRLVERWGSDERIIEAARMSTRKGFLGWGDPNELRCQTCDKLVTALEAKLRKFNTGRCACGGELKVNPGDERLLRYLWTHKHTTPFEFAGAVFEVQAPIFVFRQWFTHRTQSRTEHSARYGPLPALDYLPTPDRVCADGGANKQAQGTKKIDADAAAGWIRRLAAWQAEGRKLYAAGLDAGVPSELARGATTVFAYSRMRVAANLRNWLHFIGLRSDPHAQWEIRQYSDAVWGELDRLFPRTSALFRETFARGESV